MDQLDQEMTLRRFYEEFPLLKKDSVFQTLLQIKPFYSALSRYVHQKSETTMAELNQAFRMFSGCLILLRLIKTNVQYAAWHYKKKLRKRESIFLPCENEQLGSLLWITNEDDLTYEWIQDYRFDMAFQHPQVIEAFYSLSSLQILTIVQTVFFGYSLSELARKQGVSQQYLSKVRRKGLDRLAAKLEGVRIGG